MASSTILTLRVDSKLKKRLDQLSKTMSRSRSFVAAEAIREYVSLNEWQIEQIKQGLEEADRGEFASNREVRQTLRKWTPRAH